MSDAMDTLEAHAIADTDATFDLDEYDFSAETDVHSYAATYAGVILDELIENADTVEALRRDLPVIGQYLEASDLFTHYHAGRWGRVIYHTPGRTLHRWHDTAQYVDTGDDDEPAEILRRLAQLCLSALVREQLDEWVREARQAGRGNSAAGP
jgi:hypothetical protein